MTNSIFVDLVLLLQLITIQPCGEVVIKPRLDRVLPAPTHRLLGGRRRRRLLLLGAGLPPLLLLDQVHLGVHHIIVRVVFINVVDCELKLAWFIVNKM